jgi:hypothetical protein
MDQESTEKSEMKSSPPFSVGAVIGDSFLKREREKEITKETKNSPKKSRLKHRLDISAPHKQRTLKTESCLADQTTHLADSSDTGKNGWEGRSRELTEEEIRQVAFRPSSAQRRGS